jgi:hypothetical protein
LLIYWLLFGYFAVGALFDSERRGVGRVTAPGLFVLGGLLIAVLIGLRFEVGADWSAYVRIFLHSRYIGFLRSLEIGDPGYQALNWLVMRAGLGLWAVNLICGAVFAFGLLKLARLQPNPWLAVLVAIPYLTIVVAMGYSRQGVAIGILMLGLASLSRTGSLVRFGVYVLLATLFHKTALIAFPLAALAGSRSRILNVLLAAILTYFLYSTFLATSIDKFVRDYIQAEYSSQGAAIRVVMSLVPALLFLLTPRSFGFNEIEMKVWRNFSFAALGFLILLFVLTSSTAVDRMALYITPLQIVVLSRVPQLKVGSRLGTFLIIIYSLLVQFVWLNYAEHAGDWLPYQFYPFGHTLVGPRA